MVSDTKHIKIKDYNYPLPDERIAKFPLKQRDQSKLLVYKNGSIIDDHFYNLANYLSKEYLMVFNNTKVIRARLHFKKPTGALIEIFLLEPYMPNDYEQIFQTSGECSWVCLIGNQKKWKEGVLSQEFTVSGKSSTISAERIEKDGLQIVKFSWDNSDIFFTEIIEGIGELPIPPYLNRKTEESDNTTYQTVYSKIKGSVAAPTAGLHFTDDVLKSVDDAQIERAELTLHVGAGTFKPVKSTEIVGHEMHVEYVSIPRSVVSSLIKHEGKAIAVGTTSVRTLESLYFMGLKLFKNPNLNEADLHVGQWEPYEDTCNISAVDALKSVLKFMDDNNLAVLNSSTQIIIAPGYEFKIVKMLITNFHQPQSTLLLLVSSFVNGNWRMIYNHALACDYRFLSYGDSSLLIP